MSLKIYLAGPDVFLPDAREVGRQKSEMCRAFGFEGLFPLDNDPEVGGDALGIFRKNCALMRQADIGMFNLTPFRGPSADPGTVFELGFMFAENKSVYGYTNDPRIYLERVAATFGATGAAGRPRDRAAFAVENFGLRDNLMIVAAIEEAGGAVCAVTEPVSSASAPALAAFTAFEACLEIMKKQVGRFGGEARRSYIDARSG
jgi:nucleoside 2-deoxyribosyltransferase